MSRLDDAEIDYPRTAAGNWRIAIQLVKNRQLIVLALLAAARTAVGFCDLSLAASMYLLFLLLQGRMPALEYWWMPKTIFAAALLTSILVIFRALVDIYSSSTVFRQIQSLHRDFLLRLTRGYNEMQWSRFVERNRSEFTNHTLHTTREAADFYHRCIELVSGVVVVAAMTAAFLYQSPIAAVGFACALAAFYCVHRILIRKRVRQAASDREDSLDKLHKILAGTFLSGKEIRTYGNHDFFHYAIDHQAERFASSNRRSVFFPQVARIIADQGTMLLFFSLIVVVQLRHGDTRQILSLLAFYFVLSRRLLPLLSQISLIAGQMESSYENVRIVAAELSDCCEHRPAALPEILPSRGFVLQLENASFSFDGGAPILYNVNLSLRKGETVVLHGPSGIGKTSLLNLIAGVVQPVSGVVRVDRSAIAYVSHEIPLLDDSIRNNLLFGLPGRSDRDLMKALAIAQFDDFVAALPRGLDTGVGDNGALFSGGERQRLGLARAILRGSQVLLLDEATSALDEETESQVFHNLATIDATVFLVTHHRRAHLFAKRIFRLENSKLTEEPMQSIANGGLAFPTDTSPAEALARFRHCRKLLSSSSGVRDHR
jgi:ABC-type multidrug transport system fused ATPase/permease subunit